MPGTGAQQPSHLWSLEEIEALLSENETQPPAQPEPGEAHLPGTEGGIAAAPGEASDTPEEEGFEPLLPLFEETEDSFDPPSPPPAAQEEPLPEAAPSPTAVQRESPPAEETPTLSPAERLTQMEESEFE